MPSDLSTAALAHAAAARPGPPLVQDQIQANRSALSVILTIEIGQ